MKGNIKRLYAEKGFGFIKGQDNVEYFFHSSALQNCGMDELREATSVSFDPTQNQKGPRAENVHVDAI